MSSSGKGLFALLAVFLLISAGLGYLGIARLHQTHYPPFHDGLFAPMDHISFPSPDTIRFLDSRWGRILASVMAVVSLALCLFLTFVKDCKVLGFTLLVVAAAAYGICGVCLFLHGLLDAHDLG